jgi:hypothetical protein
MRNLLLAFVALFAVYPFAFADTTKGMPDLSKAFPTEEFALKSVVNDIDHFNFVTDLEYVELKTKLIAYLGKDWIESPQREPKTELERKMQNFYVGRSSFTNAKFPDMEIKFSVAKPRAAAGKKFIAVLYAKKVGEQAGAGQPATRSQSKSVDNQNPEPESKGRSR